MEKLFYVDSYIKNFVAEIVEAKEKDDKYHILLDKTAFFPGGGGQYCDLGTIDNIPVLDVYEENEKIYHVLDKKPNRINKVKCEIDWDRREYGMQHHFGQHVISACFKNEYNAKTVGFHLGKDFSTVDIEGFFKEDDIMKNKEIYIGYNLEELWNEYSFYFITMLNPDGIDLCLRDKGVMLDNRYNYIWIRGV